MNSSGAPDPWLPIQLNLFGDCRPEPRWHIAVAPEITQSLACNAPVFISVSGGRDSQALAYAVCAYLDGCGHTGPRMLVHSDLGRVEWRQSLPVCERLAKRLGLELVVVRRQAGDMMDRWWSRWHANVARYANLECVKLILPWSTPSTRFCTSEFKSSAIARAMRKRFPVGDVISAVGIRREESRARSRMPVWQPDARTMRKRGQGHTWHPILAWSRADVMDYIRARGDVPHEAYTTYQSTRVSCAYCIMSSLHDLRASASCAHNQAIYREMVQLEIRSTFALQSGRWLGDVAPDLLDAGVLGQLQEAKERAREREAAETLIPRSLLYVKGFPIRIPTPQEAELLARVRLRVAAAVGIPVECTDAAAVEARYNALLQAQSGAARTA
jgi:3'-phosphoadenosine 5'-phosphosulfate sulfotransferase (PAPS reductase)/FAD synthetase